MIRSFTHQKACRNKGSALPGKALMLLILLLAQTVLLKAQTATGCAGTLTNNSSGYYGGFEAGESNISGNGAMTDLSKGLPRNGSYEIVQNSAQGGGGGYLNIAPNSGSNFMLIHTSANPSANLYATTINVVAGQTYNFCAYIANAKTNPTAGFTVTLSAGTKVIATGTAVYGWTKLCGSYTAATSGTVTFSVKDPNPSFGPSHFLALDDVCITSGSAPVTSSVGDFVWHDANKNGVQDAGETGLANVTVTITGAAGFSKTTTTNASGFYQFTGLASGTYTIKYNTPSGYTATSANQGSNEEKDSDASNGSVTVTLIAGEINNSIDAGFYASTGTSTSTIGDYVWNDLNKNGIQDANEPGLANVTVTITGAGGFSKTTVTNAGGMYLFSDLAAGTYTVKFTTPAGYISSPANQGNDTKDSDPVNGMVTVTIAAGGSNLTVDAGFSSTPAPTPTTGCPGNMTSGTSGYYGGFEAGDGNISATTGGSDLYHGLPRNGSYQIVKSVDELGGGGYLNIHPQSGSYFLAAHTSNDEIDRVWYTKVAVTPGQTVNFCASVTLLKNLGDGAKYILGIYANGKQIGTGRVTFDWTQICGSYTVPDGVKTLELSIRDPKKGLFFVAIDDICITSTPPPARLTLGNQVWNDYDGDGKRDVNEPGIGGAPISLYTDKDGDNLPDGGAIKTTMSDALGQYSFTDLPEGKYIVSMPVLPGFQKTPNTSTQLTSPFPDNNVDDDNNLVRLEGPNGTGGVLFTNAITLTAGQETENDGNTNNTLDLAQCGNSYIGDFVWNDLNGNGIQDLDANGNPEPGINGVVVTITFPDGRTATTKTINYDAENNPNKPEFDGYYNFPNLGPGTYKITFATPPGLHPSPARQGGDDAKDSNPPGDGAPATVTIEADQSDFTIDAGFTNVVTTPTPPTPSCPNLSVGNMVFNDLNGNGTKESQEPGIGGLTVKLYADNDGNNVADGAAISTLMTAADGTYYFGNLAAGKYIVGVTLPDSLAIGANGNPSPDDNKDNDNNGVRVVNGEVQSNYITLSAGDEPINDGSDNNSNLALDFGLKMKNSTCKDHCDCKNDCTHTNCGHKNCGKANSVNARVAASESQSVVTAITAPVVNNTSVSVFPNPAKDYIIIKVMAQKAGKGLARITDGTGKLVATKTAVINNGLNLIKFDNLTGLNSGNYFVQLDFDYHTYNHQLIVVK